MIHRDKERWKSCGFSRCVLRFCVFFLKLNDEATKLTAFEETILDPLLSTTGVIPRILNNLIYVHQKVVPFSERCTNLIK